ncbi:MAG: twin-arginine translocation signal domain-containing protein [Planctomycetota bacterium]
MDRRDFLRSTAAVSAALYLSPSAVGQTGWARPAAVTTT